MRSPSQWNRSDPWIGHMVTATFPEYAPQTQDVVHICPLANSNLRCLTDTWVLSAA